MTTEKSATELREEDIKIELFIALLANEAGITISEAAKKVHKLLNKTN